MLVTCSSYESLPAHSQYLVVVYGEGSRVMLHLIHCYILQDKATPQLQLLTATVQFTQWTVGITSVPLKS